METFEIFLEVVDITEITVCLLVNITEIQGAILPSYISIYILPGSYIYFHLYYQETVYIKGINSMECREHMPLL